MDRRLFPRQPLVVWFFGMIITLMAWIVWQNVQLESDHALACRQQVGRLVSEREMPPSSRPAVMTFSVCNGLTNQRISIMTGFCIGKLLNRDILLPRISRDYRDPTTAPFSSLFDVKQLHRLVHPRVLLEDRGEVYRGFKIRVERAMKPPAYYEQIALNHNATVLVRFDCTLFALDFTNDEKLLSYAWEVHKVLRFAPHIDLLATEIINHLRSRTLFITVLHGRFEQDWLDHCATWKGGFNCMSSTGEMLAAVRSLSRSRLIYVAVSHGESLAPYSLLERHGYELTTKADISPEVGHRPREESAAVDYLVGEAADLYIGTKTSFL